MSKPITNAELAHFKGTSAFAHATLQQRETLERLERAIAQLCDARAALLHRSADGGLAFRQWNEAKWGLARTRVSFVQGGCTAVADELNRLAHAEPTTQP